MPLGVHELVSLSIATRLFRVFHASVDVIGRCFATRFSNPSGRGRDVHGRFAPGRVDVVGSPAGGAIILHGGLLLLRGSA